MRIIRTVLLLLAGMGMSCVSSHAQTGPPSTPPAPTSTSLPAPVAADSSARPIPDIVAMMHDVEINQHKAETIEKDYIFHSVETQQEVDGHGQIKKTTVTESDHFWVNGVPVRRVVKRDAKPLSPEEMGKEDARIDKVAAKARDRREKEDAQGKETDPRGDEEVTVSRLLELGAFTNPRRVQLNRRDTIAVDFAGDPKAKTRNRTEDIIRDLVGTAWVDERDHRLVRVEGHFVNAFKVGGGLVVNIQKDTRFVMEQTKVNDEVWLPATIEAHGSGRFLLFFNFSGNIHAVQSDYRKFRATSTILPGVTRVDTTQAPAGSTEP